MILMSNYNWSWEAETRNEISEVALTMAGKSIEDIVQIARQEAYAKTEEGLTTKAQEQGLTLSITKIDVNVTYTQREDWIDGASPRKTFYYTLKILVSADFLSDKPLIGSPIAPALMTVIKWIIYAIIAVIVAWIAIEAIKSWLQSMTTRTSIVRKYDSSGKLIAEENVTEPGLGGMWTIGLLVILAVIVFLFMRGGKGK